MLRMVYKIRVTKIITQVLLKSSESSEGKRKVYSGGVSRQAARLPGSDW